MRPVVVLGALADLVRLKLMEEVPDRFDVPSKCFTEALLRHLNTYFKGRNFREFANFRLIRESLFPRNIWFSSIHENLFSRKKPFSRFFLYGLLEGSVSKYLELFSS